MTCPLCEGNARVPERYVVPLLRALVRRVVGLPSPRLVRDASGRVLEIRELGASETRSLDSRILAGLPIWQCSPVTTATSSESG